MRSAPRYGLAILVSTLFHTGALFPNTFSCEVDPGIEPPELRFSEVQVIDLKTPQQEAIPEPPVITVPEPPPEAETPKEEKKKREFGERTARVDKVAPPTSTFFMFMNTKKVRKLPFADLTLDLLRPQPDFRFLVDEGGFHPWNDFDYMLIATADIRDYTQEFIAVRHHIGNAAIKAGVERAAAARGEEITWVTRYGKEMANPRPPDPDAFDADPRWFVLLDDRTSLYIRDEFLAAALDSDDGSGDRTKGGWIKRVTKLGRYAGAEPKAGFTLVWKDIHSALVRPPDGPPFPDSIDILAEASRSPEVVIKLGFVDAKSARGFDRWWRKDVGKMISGDLRLQLTVGGFYDTTRVHQSGKEVVLRKEFDQGQIEAFLKVAIKQMEIAAQRSEDRKQDAQRKYEEQWREDHEGKAVPPPP